MVYPLAVPFTLCVVLNKVAVWNKLHVYIPSSFRSLISDNSEPCEIVRSLNPTENGFVMFEVSDRSWHQVSEIVNEKFERLSINGWFHSDDVVPKPLINNAKCSQLSKPGEIEVNHITLPSLFVFCNFIVWFLFLVSLFVFSTTRL